MDRSEEITNLKNLVLCMMTPSMNPDAFSELMEIFDDVINMLKKEEKKKLAL